MPSLVIALTLVGMGLGFTADPASSLKVGSVFQGLLCLSHGGLVVWMKGLQSGIGFGVAGVLIFAGLISAGRRHRGLSDTFSRSDKLIYVTSAFFVFGSLIHLYIQDWTSWEFLLTAFTGIPTVLLTSLKILEEKS